MSGVLKIRSVKVCWRIDEDPDLSFLGKFTDVESEHAIERFPDGGGDLRVCRYFVPGLTAEESGDPGSPRRDCERMEAFVRGDWCMVGGWAQAEVVTPSGVSHTVRSGGLWGIESDSGDGYYEETAREQLEDLCAELGYFGIAEDESRAALADVALFPGE